ncbi:hypothetical protein [Nitrososphaera sp. AFS]|uniref:hypothetical protein n=1 Tax=Nitrososphaera sp. AFS TaxID=2301191 RepID=UPI00139239C9|nr:hypothetical protein [Nitrososphaera sp. AFS]NAL78413.1 hypothetical protein [Nitrososphaera sp. AFS]
MGQYAESIIVGGKSKYASVDIADREVRLIDYVDYLGGRFYPPPPDDFDNLNTTYIFKNEAEFDDVLERAKYETLDTIYQKVLTQWRRYSCASKYENELCAAWTIYTYFEDVFGITFYIFFIGTPDSGKTNKLRVINKLAYRNLMSTGMTAANVYRHLGSYQECQGTICEDEADNMDEDIEKMKIYKNGYTKGVRVRRNDKEGGSAGGKYSGNWYCTFGSKAFGSENSIESLGLKSRAVEMKSIADVPDWDITDVINETGDDELEALVDFRKLLFCFKLIHCHQKYQNIELSVHNREAQIFKPILSNQYLGYFAITRHRTSYSK